MRPGTAEETPPDQQLHYWRNSKNKKSLSTSIYAIVTVSAGLFDGGGELGQSSPHDGVEVGEEQNRAGQLGRHLPQHLQRAVQRRAARPRPRRRGLDHRPVGVGVGEGHAELDDVGAARVEEAQRLRRGSQVGVAGGDVRDERRLLITSHTHQSPPVRITSTSVPRTHLWVHSSNARGAEERTYLALCLEPGHGLRHG
jgi:hypothetical protein